ncbi:MAG TPA: glycosyltransferase [Clostridiaceae bacterium]|nr:glycosyltransferase [Clostridiaceae bacterium]
MSKIAYVVTQSELGGAQRNILLLAKALSGRHDITVYAAPGGLLLDELRRAGIKVVEIPSMQRDISLKDDLETYRFLVEEFTENGYEIIHSHSSKAGLLARMAGKKAGAAVNVYTAHGFVFNEPMSKMKKRLYISLER